MKSAQDNDAALWIALADAAATPAIDAALRSLYADVDAAVREQSPRCDRSGRCCKFDSYGHRLYVTALEIAWFLRNVPRPGGRVPAEASPLRLPVLNAQRDACVYQIDGLCSTHAIRPLGCRIYFCDGSDDWQHATYERFLQRLRELHDAHGLPYRYLEWRAGLDEAMAHARAS